MKTKLLLSVLLSFSFYLLSSQIPQGFNYQAIARDGSGNPILSTPLQVRLTIQNDSAGTNIVWQELHSSVTTNSFGLFTIVLGRGTRQSGSALTFDAIDWSVTPKFIKTEVNYGGWKDMGTTRFWSVPYSLYSRIAGNGFSGNYNDLANKPLLFDGTWGSLSGKPAFATVATSGSYTDLSNKPTILNSQWTTNGTSIYYNAGNVGIGNSAPVALLDVRTSANYNFGAFYSTPGAASIGAFNDLFSAWQPLSINPGGQVWFTGPAVGIGNTNPGFILDVSGRSRFRAGGGDAGFWLMDNTNATNRSFIGMMGNDYVGLYGAGGAAWGLVMNVNNGNVGIGATSPTNKLEVNGQAVINGNLIAALSVRGGGYNSGANLGGYNLEIGGPSPSATSGQATLWFHHHGVIAHQLRYTSGTLFLEAAGNGLGTNQTPTLQIGGGLYAAVNGGNVGIGTSSATSKVLIQPPTNWDDNTPLFEVKNKGGVTVFAVYNNGIRAFVQTNSGKGVKGGFAIGGFDPSKSGNVQLMNISPDSIRFYIDNSTTKATKGGFAIGSFNTSKAANQDFMYVTPQSSGSGYYNTFLGYQAGHSSTTGYSNCFLGYQAGYSSTTGANNQCIGTGSGNSLTTGSANVMIGLGAGQHVTTGLYNIILGNYAGEGVSGNDGYNIIIGNFGGYYGPIGSRKLYIDCNPTTAPLIWGDFSTHRLVIYGNSADNPLGFNFYVNGTAGGDYGWNITSDVRFKKNIETINDPLNKLMGLRGVYFNWNDSTKTEKQQMGFIAQEAKGIIPQVVNESNGYFSMDYAPITALLVEAIKSQQKLIENQNEKIDHLEKLVLEMQSSLNKSGIK